MSQVIDPISHLVSVVANTASFRERSGAVEMYRPCIELEADVSDALTRLATRVEYMRIDGWHFLGPEDSYSAATQMADNLQYVPADHAVDTSEVDRQVKPEYWNKAWIPIFSTEHQLLCVDMNPSDFGLSGQVVRVAVDGGERRFVAQSIADFCRRVVAAFEAGDLKLADSGAGPEILAREGHEFFVW